MLVPERSAALLVKRVVAVFTLFVVVAAIVRLAVACGSINRSLSSDDIRRLPPPRVGPTPALPH